MGVPLALRACIVLFASLLVQAQTSSISSVSSVSSGSGSDHLDKTKVQSTPWGVEILSDTQGVDFRSWLERWHRETDRVWMPLMPKEVEAPVLKSGAVAILFNVLPGGRIMDGSMVLEGRSGDAALDRAAWGALTGSSYPPLPAEFHGPYLKLRAHFLYNMKALPTSGDALQKAGDPLLGQQESAPQSEAGKPSVISIPPEPDKDGVYSPGNGIPAPIVIERAAAVYPDNSAIGAIENVSILSMVIDSDGIPSKIQVVHSGGADFDTAAINAVKQSTFAPGTLNGRPVPVNIFVRTRFFNDKRIAYPRILNHYYPNGASSQAAGANGLPSRLTISQGYDKPPVPTYIQSAPLSDQARAEKFQGVVLVSVLVTEDGLPTDLRVEKSIGHGLDEKAIEAVGQYRFKPAMKDGKPVAVRVKIEVNFRLY